MKWIGGKRLTKTEFVDRVEETWNIQLPNGFKTIVTKKNRSYPESNVFRTENGTERVFGELLNFELDDKNNVLERYDSNKYRLPQNAFPFAVDPAGNYICFQYHGNSKAPQIVFWNHEGVMIKNKEVYEIEKVADSFEDFIAMLYEDESEDEDLSGFQRLD